jgi:hypothetical protein
MPPGMTRALIAGWPSFVQGEATAGDVLSMTAVERRLAAANVPADLAFSPVLRPDALSLADADPARYSHLVFVCGPAHGPQVADLHRRYAGCRRIAVGVSVIDPDDPAVTGFHTVLARDRPGAPPRPDLSADAGVHPVPVIGVILAPDQREYGSHRGHDEATARLTQWINGYDCAPLPCDTRLDSRDWRHCGTPDQVVSLLRRTDMVVTTRLHGMLLALRNGVPALAVDPVHGGAKVLAQAGQLGWPAALSLSDLHDVDRLRHWWDWCLSTSGRAAAHRVAAGPVTDSLLPELVEELVATSDRTVAGAGWGRR